MNTMKRSRTRAMTIGIATTICTFLMAGPVAAQSGTGNEAPEAKDQTADDILTPQKIRKRTTLRDEVTVTVRKVEENLKDVPLSITAFDANMIEAAGITNLQDVADLTPGLTFFNAYAENLPVPIIRGVAQTDIFGETNAAIFVDGVYVAGRTGLNFSQLDVERIEVVKGPQSALYGRTAFSGAINYITKRPSDEFEMKVDVEAGNRGKQRGSAMISGPIFTDALRGRIAALYDDWDGSYNNSLAPENDIGGNRFRSYQGTLVWDPTDNFEIYWNAYYSNDEIDDAPAYTVPTNCENRIDENPADVRFRNYCGSVPDLKDMPSVPGLVDKDSMPLIARALGQDRDLLRSTLNISWDLDFGSFTSLTGYTRTEGKSLTDFGRVGEQPYLYCSGATIETPGSPNSCGANPANERFFSGVLLESLGGGYNEEFSQEIRFNSSQDQAFRYTVGAYGYSSESVSVDGGIINQSPLPGPDTGLPPFSPDAPNFAIGTAIFYCSFTADGCIDPLNRRTGRNRTTSWAVFSGVDFDFTDRLTGRAELRYGETTEKVNRYLYQECNTKTDPACGDDFYDLRVVDPLPFDPENPAFTSQSGSATFEQITGRLGLDFRINEAWMLYGSVATGDKPGGIQLKSPALLPAPDGSTRREYIVHTFDTETLTAYEIGVKGRTEDGVLGLDVAVFFNDWKDIVLPQLFETSPVSGEQYSLPSAFNINAGTAEVLGFELTTDIGFTENFSGRVSVNWNDATLTDAAQSTYEQFPTFAPDGDVSGNKLLRQPEWTGTASLSYARSLWSSWEGFARVDVSYQDKVFVMNDNQSWLGARTTANLRFGMESGRFSLAFWARNLFDNGTPIAAFRDIYWGNTSSVTPPYEDLGPRPSFEKFVPLRYTVSYPRLRTFGVTLAVRFGDALR